MRTRSAKTGGKNSLTQTDNIRSGYDGLGRLITSFVDTASDSTNNAGTTEEFYYNEFDQIIEVRKGIVTAGVKTISPMPANAPCGTTAKSTPRRWRNWTTTTTARSTNNRCSQPGRQQC